MPGPARRLPSSVTAPKPATWSGFIKVQVKEPVKELEGSKDSFVSYAIVGEVRGSFTALSSELTLPPTDQLDLVHQSAFCIPPALSRLCFPTRLPIQRLSRLRCAAFAG